MCNTESTEFRYQRFAKTDCIKIEFEQSIRYFRIVRYCPDDRKEKILFRSYLLLERNERQISPLTDLNYCNKAAKLGSGI